MPKRWIAHGCLALTLVACGDDGEGSEAQRGGLDTPPPGEDRDKSLPCEERSYDECEDDEHQTPTSFNYYWQGEVVPSNSWTQVNTYDEEGRLTRSVRTYLDVVGHVSVVDYEYTDGELTSESRVSTPDAQTSPAGASVTRYIREGALVREVIHEFAGVIRNRTLAFYDDEGRLVRLDSDGNGLAPTPDGTPDIRLAWTYDDQGNCTGFTQDGTEAFDAPFVDGVPDETRTFDPSCASIAFLPQELYRYPAWYTPR